MQFNSTINICSTAAIELILDSRIKKSDNIKIYCFIPVDGPMVFL
jgi:hypothetical protein